MPSAHRLRHLWDHLVWADARIEDVLRTAVGSAPDAIREYAHIVGSQETWLARLESRTPHAAVWPEGSFDEIHRLAAETREAFASYLAGLRDDDLARPVTYTNSAGRSFTSTVGDILTHLVFHAQYHRGKANLLLRQAGLEPAPADYIAFVRGVPAATSADASGRMKG